MKVPFQKWKGNFCLPDFAENRFTLKMQFLWNLDILQIDFCKFYLTLQKFLNTSSIQFLVASCCSFKRVTFNFHFTISLTECKTLPIFQERPELSGIWHIILKSGKRQELSVLTNHAIKKLFQSMFIWLSLENNEW